MLGVYNYTVLLTYIGMLTGLTGIGCAMGGRIPWALLCLLLAGLCDMFDGKIASTKKDRTPQEKRFGVQIDSLSDLICFGVLPGVTVYAAARGALYAALAAGLYVLAALVRLAWFNVDEEERQDTDNGQREMYLGLPVTTAALFLPTVLGPGPAAAWPPAHPRHRAAGGDGFGLSDSLQAGEASPAGHDPHDSHGLRRAGHRVSGGEAVSGNSGFVHFLYGTAMGRLLLKGILATHADRLAVAFLCSRLSRPLIGPYARRNGIPLTETQKKDFRTYRDLFLRTRTPADFDSEPSHLISPCDGWLSAYPIREDSSFAIKDSHYSLHDLLQDADLAAHYTGGDCLVLRLCPSDYHHYCYIDDGFQGENHFIPGVLHSVQPIACEKYPVFFLNRRSWTLLHTNHFGPVVQTEIGALVVGGIVNLRENQPMHRGQEKGYFELAGSTITLLFQKDRIRLKPELLTALERGEVQVRQGQWIATAPGEN